MLDNQTFYPSPLVGVGSELFRSDKNIAGIDWEVVNSFRRTILVTGIFKFVFIDVDGTQDVFTGLRDLSVNFVAFYFVKAGNAPSEEDGRKLISTLDFLYSPRLHRFLNVSNQVAVGFSKEKFVTCLRDFSSYPVPYTKQDFWAHLNSL